MSIGEPQYKPQDEAIKETDKTPETMAKKEQILNQNLEQIKKAFSLLEEKIKETQQINLGEVNNDDFIRGILSCKKLAEELLYFRSKLDFKASTDPFAQKYDDWSLDDLEQQTVIDMDTKK